MKTIERKEKLLQEPKKSNIQILADDEIEMGVGACKSCSCRGWRRDNTKSDFFDSYCYCGHHYNQHK